MQDMGKDLCHPSWWGFSTGLSFQILPSSSPGGLCHRCFPKRNCRTRASSSKGENIKAGTTSKSTRTCWITGAAETEATRPPVEMLNNQNSGKKWEKAWRKIFKFLMVSYLLSPEDSSKNLADIEATLPFFEERLASSDPMEATRIFGLGCGSSIGSNWAGCRCGRFVMEGGIYVFWSILEGQRSVDLHHQAFHHASSKKCHWNMVMGCRSWCLPVVGAPHLPQHTWHNMSCSSSARFFERTSLFLLHGKRHSSCWQKRTVVFEWHCFSRALLVTENCEGFRIVSDV